MIGLAQIFSDLKGVLLSPYWAGVSDAEFELLSGRSELVVIAGVPEVPDLWVKRLLFQRWRFADRRVD